MPAKEIKELRQSGRLDEALAMAKQEYEEAKAQLPEVDAGDPLIALHNLGNKALLLWPKRNLSWVYYEFLKLNTRPAHFEAFLVNLIALKDLELPADEKMLFDQVSWQVGKMVFALHKDAPTDISSVDKLLAAVQAFYFTKPSEPYSFLFKAFHKALKGSEHYLTFADWWDLDNLRPEDFQEEIMEGGKAVMSIAEQAYTAYAKKLVEGALIHTEPFAVYARRNDTKKINEFLPKLEAVIEAHPSFYYLPYFKAKLLLITGDKEDVLPVLLPFVRKKKNDFWAWEVLAEVFSAEQDKVFTCLCRALSCKSPQEMLINLRQKVATLLIQKQLHSEAKTEIELLVAIRKEKGWRLPNEVATWQSQEWYKTATAKANNYELYQQYSAGTDELLYGDFPEENIIVDFVNTDKKILNFIASNTRFGFFKYDRFLRNVNIGDTLKVRFNGNGSENGLFQVYTVAKTDDQELKSKYLKQVAGTVEIAEDKPFGFVNHIFIHPATIKRFNLKNNQQINAKAISSYQAEKKQWSWKVFDIVQ